METIPQILSREFKQSPLHVENVIKLIADGNTIPFIARYRKEMTGAMDDQLLRELADRLEYLNSLKARRDEVKASIAAQEKLTDELSAQIDAAKTLAEVEDIYRPYKPKRRTRAMIAREKGLEPLAEAIFLQERRGKEPSELALPFVDEGKGVPTVEDALAGACDILAENFSDDAALRGKLRALAQESGVLSSSALKDEESVYMLYYSYEEPLKRIQPHRVLAVNRGEKEGFLKVALDMPRGDALYIMRAALLKGDSPCAREVELAIEDSYDRLLFPSLSRELRSDLTEAASEAAIKTFSKNLQPLLMQAPIKNKVVLGFDPAFRTGCKLAVVDGTGKVLETAVIYPTPPHSKVEEAARALKSLIKKHGVTVIAIGNGTASRESEKFVAETIHGMSGVGYVIVNEAGASVYSASKLGAKEFPDFDVSLRSAVSIARRLQDPLAELVKIDPKSIGVGQYQHDMPQARLDGALGGVVEACVNAVGVDLNTASAPLLSRVSGIGASVAQNIVSYREQNGAFKGRKEVLKVAKLGERTYEQCAGFLRVPESREILDNTGVHPESYEAARTLLTLCGFTEADVRGGNLTALSSRVKELGEADVAKRCGVGVLTLRDIMAELIKPGRDPRDELPSPVLRSDVMEMDDLVPGMELNGTVRNVADFGAFVDIGVHQDGLVHISELSNSYVRHPSDVVKPGDIVKVWVLGVDAKKKRISLSMKQPR
ncbi:MAG: RNA-binding transcriptional accessory protein [Eubacteriales bacterium]|nr:RNA-binding transcriptional accessory protein [Eubacteriales bacterium]